MPTMSFIALIESKIGHHLSIKGVSTKINNLVLQRLERTSVSYMGHTGK